MTVILGSDNFTEKLSERTSAISVEQVRALYRWGGDRKLRGYAVATIHVFTGFCGST